MGKLKKIEDSRVKGTFTKWIKKQLRTWLVHVKAPRNLGDKCQFYLYNDGEDYSFLHLKSKNIQLKHNLFQNQSYLLFYIL